MSPVENRPVMRSFCDRTLTEGKDEDEDEVEDVVGKNSALVVVFMIRQTAKSYLKPSELMARCIVRKKSGWK